MDISSVMSSDQVRLLSAIGLGLLVGMERERHGAAATAPMAAGVRTHILISMCGFGCAWLFRQHDVYIMPVGALATAAWAAAAYVFKARQGHYGWTSEVAALLTFITGALALLAPLWLAAALGVINTLVLSEKSLLEQKVALLDSTEFLAVLKFLIVSMVILPALPDVHFTEFGLNPRQIWKIVVIVASVGFGGYFLSRRLGAQLGMWVSAVLGGLVSSTAVTVAVGRAAQEDPGQRGVALQSSLLSSAVSYVRIAALMWLVHPSSMGALWWHMAVLGLAGALLSLRCGPRMAGQPESPLHTLHNPFELTPALVFAAAFTALTVLTDMVRGAFGTAGIVLLSLVVGVTDITPFVLSLVHRGAVVDHTAACAIILALMSNTMMKGIYFGALVREARAQTAWRYGIWAAVHVLLALLA